MSRIDHAGAVGESLEPFGGPRFRDRFTDGVWQGPTWSFAIVLVAMNYDDTISTQDRVLLIAGFTIVMATTLAAVLPRWEELAPWTQALLPLGDLVGAALMVLAAPTGASITVLLCSLPVVWLAFEFGSWGLAAGITVTALTGLAPYVLDLVDIRPVTDHADVLITTLFVIGLGVVGWLMGRILHRIGDTLKARTSALVGALDLAEERLTIMNGVLDSIDIGVTVLRHGSVPLLNAPAVAMADRAGVEPGFATAGTRVFDADQMALVPAEEQAFTRALAGEEFTGVTQWVGSPGEQLAMVSSSRPLSRSDGVRLGTVMAAWDATELMDAIRVRDDFVSTVSHELRTPLTAIMASLELLEDGIDETGGTDDSPWLLASCVRNAALLDARIAELLASTRITNATMRVRSTDVAELVHLALAKHDVTAQAAGLTLQARIDPGLTADVDPARFEQVLDNLVSNAVKYTPDGGSIEVCLRAVGESLVLVVTDSGIGMTQDEQRQAFDRFYRAPEAKAQAVQGLGIGLSLVKSIVEQHHGTIAIAARLGEGTTVTVGLPRTDTSPAADLTISA